MNSLFSPFKLYQRSSCPAYFNPAQTTTSALETKVSALETLVQAKHRWAQALAQEVKAEREGKSLTQMLNDWKKNGGATSRRVES
jgi:hypothetical protein